jgi:hypothetical protein
MNQDDGPLCKGWPHRGDPTVYLFRAVERLSILTTGTNEEEDSQHPS